MLRADTRLSSIREANAELGRRLGLIGDALRMFSWAFHDVKVTFEVDESTGMVDKLLALDDVPLDHERGVWSQETPTAPGHYWTVIGSEADPKCPPAVTLVEVVEKDSRLRTSLYGWLDEMLGPRWWLRQRLPDMPAQHTQGDTA